MTTLAVAKITAEEADERFAQIAAIAAAAEPEFRTEFRRYVRAIVSGLGTTGFVSALEDRNLESALRSLDLVGARDSYAEALADLYERTIGETGSAIVRFDSAEIGFDSKHARAIRLADSRSSSLVTAVDEETRRSIRRAVADGIDFGDNPRITATRLRSQVGLIDRHARAVHRFYGGLVESGVDPSVATGRANTYAGRLLRWRTETIARTETLWSANAAQNEYWNQLADAGLLSRERSVFVWVTALDDRTCEQCWPMDGEIVGWEEPFESTTLALPGTPTRVRSGGAVRVDWPPLHPNCRCTVVLE